MKPYEKMSYKEMIRFMETKGYAEDNQHLTKGMECTSLLMFVAPLFIIYAMIAFIESYGLYQHDNAEQGFISLIMGLAFFIFATSFSYFDIRSGMRQRKKKIIVFLHEKERNESNALLQ